MSQTNEKQVQKRRERLPPALLPHEQQELESLLAATTSNRLHGCKAAVGG